MNTTMRIRKLITSGNECFICTDCGCPLEEEGLETLYHPTELKDDDGSNCMIFCGGAGLYIMHPDIVEVPASPNPDEIPNPFSHLHS